MFITREESLRRLRSPENLANILSPGPAGEKDSTTPVNSPGGSSNSSKTPPPNSENIEKKATQAAQIPPSEQVSGINPPIQANYSAENALETEIYVPSSRKDPQDGIDEQKFNSSVENIAGLLAAQGEPLKEIARNLGVPIPRILEAKREVKKAPAAKESIARIHEAALEKLLLTLGLLTVEDISVQTAVDKSKIAANLSRIVEKTGEKVASEASHQINIVVYSPQQRQESQFSVVDIQAQ